MQFRGNVAVAILAAITTACASSGAIQPDRAIFMIDNNYQSYVSNLSIEQAFDQTVQVFREAGYRLDVIDRATGQISGRRGFSGDKGAQNDKDLKVYVIVLPENGKSRLKIKIVQVISSGPLGANKTEIIVNDPDLYRYLFQRIETIAPIGASSDSQRDESRPLTELP